MSHDGRPMWTKERIEDMRRALTAEYGPERGLTESRKGFGGATAETEIESLRAQLAEYRAAITALDCWMEKHDPKARSDYWRWRHRYHAIVTDARGDHE